MLSMMRASSKLAIKAFNYPSRFRLYSHLRLSHRFHAPGFAAWTAHGRFLSVTFHRLEQIDLPPCFPRDLTFQALRNARNFASCPLLTRTSPAFLTQSSLPANSEKGSSLSSQSQGLPCGHLGLHRYTHSSCKLIRDADEEVESDVFVSLSELDVENIETQDDELNGASIKTQESFESSTTNSEDVVCTTQVCQDKESDMQVVFKKPFRKFKRFKLDPEGTKLCLKLDLCSKLANLHGALQIYNEVKKEQRVQLDVNNYNKLLYLCSGAASGSLYKDSNVKRRLSQAASLNPIQEDRTATNISEGLEHSNSSKVLVHFSPEDIELGSTRGADILEDMLNQGVEPNEATYTSIIRLAVAKNNGDLAFETIKLMESSGTVLKLRSYAPVLTWFCESNKAEKAYEVDNHMANAGVQPDESLLDSLLKVSTHVGRADKVYALLHRLRRSVRDLLPTTVNSIEKWFTSENAALAGMEWRENLPLEEVLRQTTATCGGGWHGLGWLGTGGWQVRRTSISETGSCLSCGETLSAIDLDVNDTEEFADRVATLACKKQRQPNTFKHFQEWISRHGPFEAVIDGANVGLYNPKLFRGFNMPLLNAVVNAATTRLCTRKPPLVLIHSRHVDELTRNPKSAAILKQWKECHTVYFTPPGSNDDWFWLYASVKCKCMLVTNDQMRDHMFAVLGNNFFPKWRERHQVKFLYTVKGLNIHMPPPYSTIIQESMKGSWHVPQAGYEDSEVPREWLCVTRASSAFGG